MRESSEHAEISEHAVIKKRWWTYDEKKQLENHKTGHQMGNIWKKRERGQPHETLKITLTREAMITGIRSHDENEKLSKNRDSWKNTF